MAALAQGLPEQRQEVMGLPCEKNSEEKPGEANNGGAVDSRAEPLDSAEPLKMSSGPDAAPNNGFAQSSTPSAEGAAEAPDPSVPVKKKRGRKRKADMIPKTPPPPETPSPTVWDEPELTSSGRPKRRAAKIALDYLQNLAKDLEQGSITEKDKKDADKPQIVDTTAPVKKPGKRRGRKRKVPDCSDNEEDEDFCPAKEEVESEDNDDVDSEPEADVLTEQRKKSYSVKSQNRCMFTNGLINSVMAPVMTCFSQTKKFREENFSPWVYPEWIPSVKDWQLVSSSDADQYLPQEKKSAMFTFTRENLKDKTSLQTVKRFESLPYHHECWDSMFFTGGPVHSMEWCPCPDGSEGNQYAAIYCHKGMDDKHKTNALHTGPVLIQLWDLGKLQCKSRPSVPPRVAYALAVDDGCVWDMKWCPAGSWELPCTERKAPQMTRLGLLAAAFSNGNINIYSLPHPEALEHHLNEGEASGAPLICRVKPIVTLKMGYRQMDHKGQCGLCLTIDWVNVKPHNLLAAGFTNGLVGSWDLTTKSPLLKVKEPGGVILYPYHCFHAHNECIRSLTWCKASSNLLVTVGDDRMAKMWDLRKKNSPLHAVKRCLATEVCWPLFWSGILIAQECCFSTHGQHGIHYFDSGFFATNPHFVCPRKATVWSISLSDWINTFVVGDDNGDCLFCLLPDIETISHVKRRRFSLYRTDLIPIEPSKRTSDAEEDGGSDEEHGLDPETEPQTYNGARKKYYLHFHDLNLMNFAKVEKRPMMKHLQQYELKGSAKVSNMQLNALYKVRLNPNMDAYTWVLSGGQSGLVRVHCLRGLSCSVMLKELHETRSQFRSMFMSQDSRSATVVHHSTADTVQVR